MPVIQLLPGSLVRIERSPYFAGHYYFRFKNADADDDGGKRTMTLGFGYDEPYRDKNVLMNNPLVIQARMFNTIVDPVGDKWIIYQNDHPRNESYLPNKYHVFLDWLPMHEDTIKNINNVVSHNGTNLSPFDLPFSGIASDTTHNCRSILLDFIKDSLTNQGYLVLRKYLGGNPWFNDTEFGCVTFHVVNGDVHKDQNWHPCGWLLPISCCHKVHKPDKTDTDELTQRVPYVGAQP